MKRKFIKTLGILVASASIVSMVACTSPLTQNTPSTTSEGQITSESDSITVASEEKVSEAVTSEEPSEEALEDAIDIDYKFISKNKDNLKMGFPEEITRDGKTYVYSGMADYNVTEELEVIESTVEVAVEDQADLDRSISYKSKTTGNTYYLSADGAYINWGELKKIPKKVTEVVDWGPRMDAVSIEPVRAITYFNKYTNQEETVSGKLVSSIASEPFWAAAEEPITGTFSQSHGDVDHYDTTLITAEGKQFSVPLDNGIEGAYPSWNGYQNDVLKILGLDPAAYRVTGCAWKDKPYWGEEFYTPVNKNVVVEYRDAVYPFEALCRSYKATYEAEGETLGYQTEVVYYVPVSEVKSKGKYTEEQIKKDIETIYKVNVTAKYVEKR